MHTVIISGLIGWAVSIQHSLEDAGYDCELITRGNLIIVYNTTIATVEQSMNDAGYGGGKFAEVD